MLILANQKKSLFFFFHYFYFFSPSPLSLYRPTKVKMYIGSCRVTANGNYKSKSTQLELFIDVLPLFSLGGQISRRCLYTPNKLRFFLFFVECRRDATMSVLDSIFQFTVDASTEPILNFAAALLLYNNIVNMPRGGLMDN